MRISLMPQSHASSLMRLKQQRNRAGSGLLQATLTSICRCVLWRFGGAWRLLQILQCRTIAAVATYDLHRRLQRVMTVHRSGIFVSHVIQEADEASCAPLCADLMAHFRSLAQPDASSGPAPESKHGGLLSCEHQCCYASATNIHCLGHDLHSECTYIPVSRQAPRTEDLCTCSSSVSRAVLCLTTPNALPPSEQSSQCSSYVVFDSSSSHRRVFPWRQSALGDLRSFPHDSQCRHRASFTQHC